MGGMSKEPKSGPLGGRGDRQSKKPTNDRVDVSPSFKRTGGKSSGFQILGKITKKILGIKDNGK